MRKIILRGSAKTADTDFAEAQLYMLDTDERIINDDAWQAAVENAEMYGWQITEEDCSDDDEEWYDSYCTANEIDGWWEDYNGEEHDELRCGGGSFEEDFALLAARLKRI